MKPSDHHNATAELPNLEPEAAMIVTLSELSAFIKTSEAVPADRKRYLSSA